MKFFVLLISLAFSGLVSASYNFSKDFSVKKISMQGLSRRITHEVFQHQGWPEEIVFEGRKYELEYGFDKKLIKYIKKLMRRHPSDYTSVVVLDNKSGNVLAALDFNKAQKRYGKNITFSTTHPAASIFKVVTAADLLEQGKVDVESSFKYNGKSSTLYKYQLKNKITKWTRSINFEKAFALSNNVVFGKAAIQNTTYDQLNKTAYNLGFNQQITSILNLGYSKLFQDDDWYGLAEYASGFNRKTMISPVHGAAIASIAANDGILKFPKVVTKITEAQTGRVIWGEDQVSRSSLSKETALDLQQLMNATIKKGTARGAFRKWLRRNKNFRVGGKTGSITGGLPYGKRDWFISYASPSADLDEGISICVMIVNIEKWYIKSTVFAKEVIDYYYNKKG